MQRTPELPLWASGEAKLDALNTLKPGSPAYGDAYEKVPTYLEEPSGSRGSNISDDWRNRESWRGLSRAVLRKHGRLKAWLHPKPGLTFTYEGWKAGRVAEAVVQP